MDEEIKKIHEEFGEKTLEMSERPFEELITSIIFR